MRSSPSRRSRSIYPACSGKPVLLVAQWRDGVALADGEVALLENVRFNPGEKKDDEALSRAYAALCDIFVMDAFGTAHRAEASTHGVAKYAPVACAGPLLEEELRALTQALSNPARPLVAIVGGSKVSTKLEVLEALVRQGGSTGGGRRHCQYLSGRQRQPGRQIAVRTRPHSHGPQADAKNQYSAARRCGDGQGVRRGCAGHVSKPAADVADDDMILDIGPEAANQIAHILKNAGTILWNGPVGVFEFDQFAEGTKALALAIAESPAFSLAGGGDTLAAIDKFGIADKVSYISTGGGAFLEYVEGKILPAVAMLEQRAGRNRSNIGSNSTLQVKGLPPWH